MTTAPPVKRTGSAPEANLSETDVRTFMAIRRLVERGDHVWMVVTGVSMEPTLKPGDRVLLGPVMDGTLGGGIVLADVGGRPVLHRVMVQTGGFVVTAGDACGRSDMAIPRSAVVACAHAVYSGDGVSALRPTLRYGGAAMLRYLGRELRALSARLWMRLRHRRPTPVWIWSR